MKSLSPESCTLVNDDKIWDEMNEMCPTVLKAFYGIFLQTPSVEEFTPEMRTAVASFARNRNCYRSYHKIIISFLCLLQYVRSRKIVCMCVH
jgi:hypothetical protein